MAKIRNILTFILIIIGISLCVELGIVYYNANFEEYAMPSFCSVNDFVDCDGVARTSYSQFFGIPLFLWGLFLYVFSLFLMFAGKLKNFKLFRFAEVFKNPNAYIFVLFSLGFAVSMLLAGISFFKIEKICVLCFVTYFLDLGIALLNKDYKQNLFFELKQSVADFISAIKIKKYLISLIIVSITGISVLSYTTISNVLAPQMKPKKWSVFPDNVKKDGNKIGNPDAKVTIDVYLDYNCPGCFFVDLYLRRILTEFDNILLIHHNYPLDSECNKIVTNGGHQGSCVMARYVLAAKNQDKYWDVNSLLFEKSPKSEKEIKKILKEIKGLNIKKLSQDANSGEIRNELEKEVDEAHKNEFDVTPTIIINKERYTGDFTYTALKEKLIELGAKEL